jgi:hypothetical protein
MKKAIILGLVLSAGVFVSTVPADAGVTPNGVTPNGMGRNGVTPNSLSSTPGLDFTAISQQRLGK